MGLFKSRSQQAADDAIDQTRRIGSRLAGRAGSALDDGNKRLHGLIDDLESTLRSSDLDVSSLRDNLRGKLDKVRSSVSDRSAMLSQDFSEALGTADEYAHQKPWQVIGAVAGIALVVGFLAGRS